MAIGLLSGPMVWSEHDKLQDYIVHLQPKDLAVIEFALQHFNDLGTDLDSVSRESFKLSASLIERLRFRTESLFNDAGFFVIRGLDATKYSADDNTAIFLGLTSHIADQRGVQDRKGNVLTHITSSKKWDVPVEQRHGIHSQLPLPFHNDMGCEILALHCREAADLGGSTFISSAAQICNKLTLEEPEVLKTLTSPDWPVQTSGADAQFYLAPAWTIHEGRLWSSMDPGRFGPHARSEGLIPGLSKAQRHALSRVSDLAQEIELELKLEPGDILLFNNWALLHRRAAYKDGKDITRHLVRLWLRNTELGWAVPPSMSVPWEAAYGDHTKMAKKEYLVEPRARYEVPKYTAGTAAFVLED